MRCTLIALQVLSIAFMAAGAVSSPTNRDQADNYPMHGLSTTRLLRSIKAVGFDLLQEERTIASTVANVAEKAASSLTKLDDTARTAFLQQLKALGNKVGTDHNQLAIHAVETLTEQGKKPIDELVALSIWLHGVPNKKDLAESMQRYLSMRFSSSRTPLINAWAKSRVKPGKIYKLLRVDTIESTNTAFRQWLAYIQKLDDSSFYQQALSLMKAKQPSDLKLATVLQSIKGRPELELEKVAEKLQTDLFKTMIARNVKPSEFNKLHNGHTILENESIRLSLAKSIKYFKEDPHYHILKAYTMQYAEATGADIKKVKGLFESNKPEDALKEAVAKVA